jgi:hypothetical protein
MSAGEVANPVAVVTDHQRIDAVKVRQDCLSTTQKKAFLKFYFYTSVRGPALACIKVYRHDY